MTLDIPVWDGNANKLPEPEKLFEFEGETYVWLHCDCGEPSCARPTAYPAGEANESAKLTVLLRGTDQGYAPADVVARSDVVTLREFADALETGVGLKEVFQKVRSAIPTKAEELEVWLTQRDLTNEDYRDFKTFV